MTFKDIEVKKKVENTQKIKRQLSSHIKSSSKELISAVSGMFGFQREGAVLEKDLLPQFWCFVLNGGDRSSGIRGAEGVGGGAGW